MSFMSELKNQLNDKYNVSVTENGAIGYETTSHPLLDLNFEVASMRSASAEQIILKFRRAFIDDPELAIRWLFYARDIRGGLGERRLFRIIIDDLSTTYPEIVSKIIDLIPYYGRYDDLVQLIKADNYNVRTKVAELIKSTLAQDEVNMEVGKPITLLAKWLPSTNAGKESRSLAITISNELRITENQYRRKLSKLRKYLDVVERKMCAGEWSGIDYSKVPSRAALIYSKAFNKHDPDGYSQYIDDVKSGESKINASTLYPHDIVAKYGESRWNLGSVNDVLEEMWKAQPNFDLNGKQMLVVRDGSSSMLSSAGRSNVSCLAIATALSIYFAERIEGEFHNQFITFSSRPKLVDLSNCNNLHDKLYRCYAETDCSNTDIYKVFDLILDTATAAQMDQSQMPANILIFSDMEFDGYRFDWNSRLFDAIRSKYEAHGYKIPRLIFWNLNSRSQTIPMIKNDLGLVLTSGFSANAAKMIMSGELDPMKALEDILNSDRYAPVADALNKEV